MENCGILAPYITVAGKNICYYDGYDSATSAVTKDYPFRRLAGGPLSYVMVPGTGTAEDYQGLDVQGKIAVVQRGGSYYEAKARPPTRRAPLASLYTTTSRAWSICPSPPG